MDDATGTAAAGAGARDAGWEAHQAAVAHLNACVEALDAEDEGCEPVESPSVGPYCGCTDCDVREILAAAWPILLDDAADRVAAAGHPEAAQVLRAETGRVRHALVTINRAETGGAPQAMITIDRTGIQ